MKKLAIALAASGLFALSVPSMAIAAIETEEARMEAASAADTARWDMVEVFGPKILKPGQYLWAKDVGAGAPRVVVSLSEQMAYVYRGDRLVGVTTISSGKPGNDTPTGIFPVKFKKEMHHSRKYDSAPMPHMQMLDDYGIALHAGFIAPTPASHGCVRLPKAFAARLYGMTQVGTPVLIAA
ncbi:MAG TPA: L,D-transpeptidase family protein [Sphingomicrobium sp.]|nr:L,D-transpeptidase family protein [Sphingomicrobium sp.]